ncbi:MAG TPA: GAP family protein [Glaciihabitans sp.]|jgi:threonine/homoserine/homoserine lactone efflux protein|nr:GAP family protein [Glaciihabitans sp.]
MLSIVLLVLPIGLGALLASIPVAAMSSVVATVNTRSVLASFIGGWVTGILAVATLTILLIDVSVVATDTATWVIWLRIALGLVLAGLGARQLIRRLRGNGSEAEPAWLTSLRTITHRGAFVTAFVLGSVNPKSLVIVVSAVATIASATQLIAEQVVAIVIFTAVASLGVAAPALALIVGGDRAAEPLTQFVAWFTRHSEVIISLVLITIGVLIAADAIGELTLD